MILQSDLFPGTVRLFTAKLSLTSGKVFEIKIDLKNTIKLYYYQMTVYVLKDHL